MAVPADRAVEMQRLSLWLATQGLQTDVPDVVNDLHGRPPTFWQVLRAPELFPESLCMVQATLLSRAEWPSQSRRFILNLRLFDPGGSPVPASLSLRSAVRRPRTTGRTTHGCAAHYRHRH